MVSINALFSQIYRFLIGSGAVLLLSSVIMTSANAADIAASYNNSCAACHDSGALNAIKKGDSAKWQQLTNKKVCRR